MHTGQAKTISFSEINLKTIEGKPTTLKEIPGKIFLIVNTASECGYTPQYKNLQAVWEKYKNKEVTVLGFPSNDFGAQEPGSNVQIKQFCQKNYGVSFPLFEKLPVKGPTKQPLFSYLVQNSENPGQEITWNFEKFVVNREGKVLGRFKSDVKPDDKKITDLIDKNL